MQDTNFARKRLAIGTLEPTRYEVGMYDNDQLVKVLGYTARKTKQILITYFMENRHKVLKLHTGRDTDCILYKNKTVLLGNVQVRFTGRTERDAAI